MTDTAKCCIKGVLPLQHKSPRLEAQASTDIPSCQPSKLDPDNVAPLVLDAHTHSVPSCSSRLPVRRQPDRPLLTSFRPLLAPDLLKIKSGLELHSASELGLQREREGASGGAGGGSGGGLGGRGGGGGAEDTRGRPKAAWACPSKKHVLLTSLITITILYPK